MGTGLVGKQTKEEEKMKLRADIPRQITRPCCPGKDHGDVELQLAVTATIRGEDVVPLCGYRRDNDDWYYGPYYSVDELIEALDGVRR